MTQPGEVTPLARVLGSELGADRDHAAADIDSDASWHYRTEGGHDGTDRGALTMMCVRHQGQVREDERHRCCPLSLLASLRLQDRRPVEELLADHFHNAVTNSPFR